MTRPKEIPADVSERISRAKNQIRTDSVKRQECLNFYRGDQYVQRTYDGYLVSQGTVLGEKPKHRPRTTRNLIAPYTDAKISSATQRIPGYEINPTTADPEDISAAKLSEKIAHFGYRKWNVRRVTQKVVTSALVMDGGFAMPYWDTSVGPFLDDGTGIGEVGIRTFTGDEIGWEPGLEFDESPYHVVCQARSIDDVMAMPGFIRIDGEVQLTPDASSNAPLNSSVNRSGENKLVMVTEYLERPCAKYQKGRRVVEANGRQILKTEDYPCAAYGYSGICLHPLTFAVDPEADRDRGMVIHMLDAQRTYNNCTNQQISWAQLALNPQIIGPPMANKIKFTDEPGAYYTVVPINGMTPQWRPVPPIPAELSQMKEEAKQDMMVISAADEIPDNVESAKFAQLTIEQTRSRWAAFLMSLADWSAELMAHCLELVQTYYTEPRLVSLRGRTGWENIADFKGAMLRDQTDVTVSVGSIEPRSREFIERRVQWLVQMFPGFVSPEAALAAINGGTGEKLIESYELDVARAQLMIQKILAGAEMFLSEPLVDPMAPPSWAPRQHIDNAAVHIHIFGDYCKTPDYDQQPPEVQEALRLYLEACIFLRDQAAMQQAMQQQQMAEGLGMQNAAGPQAGKPMPSIPGPGGAKENPAPPQ